MRAILVLLNLALLALAAFFLAMASQPIFFMGVSGSLFSTGGIAAFAAVIAALNIFYFFRMPMGTFSKIGRSTKAFFAAWRD